MKVRVCYTIEVNERFRRALNYYHGVDGLASRDLIKRHYEAWGDTMDEEVLWEYDAYVGPEAKEGE